MRLAPQGPAPGAPWHAHPPPGTPPPGGSRARRIAVTVIVAIVLVAAAGGVWLWTSGGGGGSEQPDTPAARDYDAAAEAVGVAEVAWQVEQGEAPEAVGVDYHWVTDGHLVRRLPGRVVAYELKTGEEAWEVPVGKVEDGRCASSVEHSNLRVALLVSTGSGTSRACEELVVVDIGTGKEVATADLPPIGASKVGAVPVVFGENVIIPSNEAIDDHVMAFNFGGDNHGAVWRDGLFVIFSVTHRTASQGEPDTAAFSLSK